jgi:hypothetical protein
MHLYCYVALSDISFSTSVVLLVLHRIFCEVFRFYFLQFLLKLTQFTCPAVRNFENISIRLSVKLLLLLLLLLLFTAIGFSPGGSSLNQMKP